MKNHSFPKTYTTLGAVNRAKKIYSERFTTAFKVTKEDGKFVLDVDIEQSVADSIVRAESTEAQEVEAREIV